MTERNDQAEAPRVNNFARRLALTRLWEFRYKELSRREGFIVDGVRKPEINAAVASRMVLHRPAGSASEPCNDVL